VTVVALHPGITPSGLQRHMGVAGAVLNALTAAWGGVGASAARVVAAATAAEPHHACEGVFPMDSACGVAFEERVWAAGEAALSTTGAKQGV